MSDGEKQMMETFENRVTGMTGVMTRCIHCSEVVTGMCKTDTFTEFLSIEDKSTANVFDLFAQSMWDTGTQAKKVEAMAVVMSVGLCPSCWEKTHG